MGLIDLARHPLSNKKNHQKYKMDKNKKAPSEMVEAHCASLHDLSRK
jgi:hypothetical protein